MPRKRQHSHSRSPERNTKRTFREAPITISDHEEEESLEVILARIQEQEQSEALARQLDAEWNQSTQSSSSIGNEHSETRQGSNVIVIDNDEGEDDEAMARRLAQEWANEGVVEVPGPSNSKSGKSRAAGMASSPSNSSSSTTTRKGMPGSVDAPVTSPDTELLPHRNLFVLDRKCTKCGGDVESPRGHVTYSHQIPPPSLLYLLHATCMSCKTNHCRGCFSVLPCPPSCKGKIKKEQCPVVTCCGEVRAIALFEALGGFDRLYLGEQATAESRAKETAAKNRATTVKTVGPGGTGYSTGSSNYDDGYLSSTSHGPGRKPASSSSTSTRSNADSMAAHWDELLVRALTTITKFLPAPYSEQAEGYDFIPHGSIKSLLLLSQLPDLLARLLRNDSVMDWIKREELYRVMLGLLRSMADCELTIQVLVTQRFEMKKSCGLEDWMWQDDEITWEKTDEVLVKASPLYSYFQKLTKQCETFLAGASHMLEGGEAQDADDEMEMMKATSLCGDIIAARDEVERAMKILGKDPSDISDVFPCSTEARSRGQKGKSIDPSLELERSYTKECERLAFKYVTLSEESANGNLTYPGFNYAQQLSQTASSTRNPKDRMHLIKELAVMATSLPAGMWMRLDEVRNDAIKVMIAGPEGTPYAGGLFEFDCFLPLEYPNKPPLMHLRTTGNGYVRFNPNLYNGGKVCLSLLGTWAGRPEEMWSRKSTLLQVFVSIQSMILIDLPFFNEPGYGQANPKDGRSIEYNKDISAQTTRWAIVEWLKDEHENGLWADVIKSHFSIRHEKVRKCIQEWAKKEPRIRNYNTRDNRNYSGPSKAAGFQSSQSVVRNSSQQASSSQNMDLLKEYDLGIERVKGWDI